MENSIVQLEQAKEKVLALERIRLQRGLADTSHEFQHIFQLIPLLLHLNYPNLPGYINNVPSGIANFQFSDYQRKYLSITLSKTIAQQLENTPLLSEDILGIYVMGSIASVAQTSSSDLDIWVCYRTEITPAQYKLLQQKCTALQQWAKKFNIELCLFLMNQTRFRHFRYSETLTDENCGSTQYMLLLDEFYRSAIRLAGKPLLWCHLLIDDEKNYEQEVKNLLQAQVINPADWVDFGGLGSLSANEYFGATLWQLYKGIDFPYKSVLKILLLETYSREYPNTKLLSIQLKNDLLLNKKVTHHFDPYLAMLEKVTAYLVKNNDLDRLNFVRRCFYAKASVDILYGNPNNWRIYELQQLAQKWDWPEELLLELNQSPFWKMKNVKHLYDQLLQILMQGYRNLLTFARKNHVDANIMPQDMHILTRKLYAAFEQLPGKVTLFNPHISKDLSEPHLTFIEVSKHKNLKAGWYLVNQEPHMIAFSEMRYIEYGPHLNKLVAWAYFNGILTANTQIHISSQSIGLNKLRHFVTDLRLFFPLELISPTGEELHNECKIRHLMIAINLTSDPTIKFAPIEKENISPNDLFSFGPEQQSLVSSIDLTYCNIWNEIRTLHFEGPNAILSALKILSNKISRHSATPKSIGIYCYSQYYSLSIRSAVSVLVHKCINAQVNASTHYQLINQLRVAGKTWQFVFAERGINLQEIAHSSSDNQQNTEIQKNWQKLTALPAENKTHGKNDKFCHYPYEINAFASEGFLQFFFEDNPDNSFNVYILDEANHIEIYRNCRGSKLQKIKEINHIYVDKHFNNHTNSLDLAKHNFNYPQFYQLLPGNTRMHIRPFHSHNQ